MKFNGVYTIRNLETGEHRTVSVKTQKDDARFAAGKRIVALLNGPNNNTDYEGFGFVTDEGINVWTKKRGRVEQWSSYEWFAFMLWDLAENEGRGLENLGKRYELLVEKRCLRCNRRLTTPESIESGIGPICAAM